MHGYDSTSYGEAFADVYDDWYADVTDVDATVERLVGLAGPAGRVLELGVGTGRLAIPMARAGLQVTGIDSSRAMLDRLEQRRGEDPVTDLDIVCGDMVSDLPDGPFEAALIAYNTLFNLLEIEEQCACFVAVAERLVPGGHFVVETVVPDDEAPAGSDVTVRSMTADRVVLSVSDHRPDEHRTNGQFVELTESGGVRLRPWAIRWSTVVELDEMADHAGFDIVSRSSDMTGTPFERHSDQHVTVYRQRSGGGSERQ